MLRLHPSSSIPFDPKFSKQCSLFLFPTPATEAANLFWILKLVIFAGFLLREQTVGVAVGGTTFQEGLRTTMRRSIQRTAVGREAMARRAGGDDGGNSVGVGASAVEAEYEGIER